VAITVPCICKENKQKAIEVAKTYANWVAIYKSRSEITNLVPHSDIKEELMNSDELELFHKSINSIVLGNSEECKQEIDHLAKKYEADEVIIVNVSYHFRDRLETYDRLAKEYKLAQGGY
jgi:alkanesulfonate monooxygenase SsuD/methylene tetrahydromethanopterin reductase-like flavin-dependent oxidoreductase (luciferase family)